MTELITYERVVFTIILFASMPLLWMIFKSTSAKELRDTKKALEEVIVEVEELRKKEKQQVDREKKLMTQYLEEKRKSLDLKHKVVDLIARNQETFKEFDKYLDEKGIR